MIDEKKLIEVLERNFGGIGGASVLKQLIEAQPKISLENKTSDWISVEEALPKDGETVIFSTKDGLVESGWYDAKQNWCVNESYFPSAFKVIAWQPLPPKYEG